MARAFGYVALIPLAVASMWVVTACSTRSTCPDTCAAGCTDVQKDALNCGGCGKLCDTQLCYEGECISTCPAGTWKCETTCVNLNDDVDHCGACGHSCNGGTCSDGKCVCPPGANLCDNACVDTNSDTNHCGACGVACLPGLSCVRGACECVGTECR